MKHLPQNPSFEYLRREARGLRAKHRSKDISVFKIIGHFDTSFHGLDQDEVFARKFSIIDAQRVTARQYCFASWRRLKLFVQKETEKTSAYNPVLRQDLLRRNEMRLALIRRAKDKRPGSQESLRTFNEESQEIVRKIYERFGWPGPQLVRRDGLEACYWLAVSHSGNSKFQYECAMLMKEALPKGECYGLEYAVTIDRWLCLSYKPTIYGCFNDFNVETGRVEYTKDFIDPVNINKRRAEVGLPNFEAANQDLHVRSTAQKWPRFTKADWEKMKRQWSLEGGYISG